MKKIWKKLLSITLTLVMLLAAIPVQAADDPINLPATMTYSLEPNVSVSQKEYLCDVPAKVSSLQSSNPSVAIVRQTKTEDGRRYVYLGLKKGGKTTISFKYNSKTYKTNVRVYNYYNPISSVTIGKTKIPASKFHYSNEYTLKYSDFADQKVKVTFRLKDGWLLSKTPTSDGYFRGFDYFLNGWAKSESVKNGSYITIKGGEGAEFWVFATKKSTGQFAQIKILFK